MPTCGSCGITYHNFQGKHVCPRRDVPNTMGWGTPFSHSSPNHTPAGLVEKVFVHPFRHRTGTLSQPPEYEPPEAA